LSGAVFGFNHANWVEQVLRSERPVLVDFRIHGKCPGGDGDSEAPDLFRQGEMLVKIGFLDVSKCLDLALRYRIQDLPTLCLFEGGEVRKSCKGPGRFWEMFSFMPEQHDLGHKENPRGL
jgi:Thioredoxin